MFDALISAEMELLLRSMAPGDHPRIRARQADLLHGPIDWAEVFRLGLLHGALPMLHRRLAAMDGAGVSRATYAELSRYVRMSEIRNEAQTAELLAILSHLDASRIGAVPFKGPALAARLYPIPSLRQFGDLDILVRRSDVEAVQAVLRARGYRAWRELSEAEEKHCLRKGKDRPFVSSGGNFAVEIHWRFAPQSYPFAMDAESVWPRLERQPLAGYSVLAIPNEELLLILCVHGTRHQWSSLKWVCDVAALIALEGKTDWDRVFREAKRVRVERVLFTGLILAKGLLDAPVPVEAQSKMCGDPIAVRLALQVWNRIRAGGNQVDVSLSQHSFQIAARERLKDRLRLLLHVGRMKAEEGLRGNLGGRPSGPLHGIPRPRILRLLSSTLAGSVSSVNDDVGR